MATGAEIAVVGISGRFPGAKNIPEFWGNLKAGHEAIKPADGGAAANQPNLDATAHWVEVNSLLPDVDQFDASFFGFNPREAEDARSSTPRFPGVCRGRRSRMRDFKPASSANMSGSSRGPHCRVTSLARSQKAPICCKSLPCDIANDRDYLATRAVPQNEFVGAGRDRAMRLLNVLGCHPPCLPEPDSRRMRCRALWRSLDCSPTHRSIFLPAGRAPFARWALPRL